VTPSNQTEAHSTADAPLVLRGATIVDVTDGRLLPDQTVIIARRRIRMIGATRTTQVPPGARVVDAKGKYLIPGLWDMHVHLYHNVHAHPTGPDVAYPRYIASGITGVRDMGEMNYTLDSTRRWREEIATGRRVGPRIIAAGPFLSGPGPGGGGRVVRTPEEGRRVVDSLKAAGADFIKVYANLSRATYFAMAAEARRLGIPFAGHVTDSVTQAEAADSGQRSFEHSFWVLQDKCSPSRQTAVGLNADRCAALSARMAARGTAFVPTLSVFRVMGDSSKRSSLAFAGTLLPSRDSTRRPNSMVAQIGAFQQAGVMILAGTDNVGGVPAALHLELTLLVENAGLTPLQALQAATLNPAKYLGATDSLGTVAPGKLADLVLLNANPLADIRHTTEIEAVVADGRYFDRAALEALLAETERIRRALAVTPERTP
jgi:imidazolonepropionase-like amidohydrolase